MSLGLRLAVGILKIYPVIRYLCHMAFIQTDTFTIRGYECDAFGRMSIPALMNMMQESANRNALDYGIGIADLAERGVGWMLMRFNLRMHQYPRYGETIRVVTYPTTVEKYFIHRDFRVLAEDGTLLAEAGSTWLVFSIEKRTMVPMPDFIRSLNPPTGLTHLAKLPLKPDFQSAPFTPDKTKERSRLAEYRPESTRKQRSVCGVAARSHRQRNITNEEIAEIDLVYRTESHWGD